MGRQSVPLGYVACEALLQLGAAAAGPARRAGAWTLQACFLVAGTRWERGAESVGRRGALCFRREWQRGAMLAPAARLKHAVPHDPAIFSHGLACVPFCLPSRSHHETEPLNTPALPGDSSSGLQSYAVRAAASNVGVAPVP